MGHHVGKNDENSSYNNSNLTTKIHGTSQKNSHSKFSGKTQSSSKFPPLANAYKHQKSNKIKDNDHGFPDPSFSLKEIPFPNVERYKQLSDRYYDLLKEHVETREDKNPVNQKVADYINTGLYGLRAGKDKEPSPQKSILKQTTSPSSQRATNAM